MFSIVLAVINTIPTILTVPTMRKIRAYNRGDFRNTAVLAVTEIRTFFGFFENGLPVVGVLHSLKHPAALPGHEAVEPLVVGACRMRIPGLNAYKLQNAHNIFGSGCSNSSTVG